MSKHRYGPRRPIQPGDGPKMPAGFNGRNLEQTKGITPMMRWLLAPSADHDAARRISDTYNLHLEAAGTAAIGQYIACALEDGTSDGDLYPTKRDAMRMQKSRPDLYCYPRIVVGGLERKDALVFLHFCRDAFRRGLRLTDPDDARDVTRRMLKGNPYT